MRASHHSIFLQAGCSSCRPTNSVEALKGNHGSQSQEEDIAKVVGATLSGGFLWTLFS